VEVENKNQNEVLKVFFSLSSSAENLKYAVSKPKERIMLTNEIHAYSCVKIAKPSLGIL
jgi:hypothetical protein